MKSLDFIFAARPLLLMPVWTVYLVCLHYHHTLSGGSFDYVDLILLFCLSLLFAGAFYINQVFDVESDRLNKKCGFIQSRFISSRAMMAAFLIVSIVPMGLTPLLSPVSLIIFLQVLILAVLYSAPPTRFKDRPLGGLLTNAWAHGLLVAVAVMPEITMHNACALNWSTPLYFMLSVGATYVLTTIPDVDGDRLTGKRTLAVALGQRWALVIALVLVMGSGVVAYVSELAPLFYISSVATFLILAAAFLRAPSGVLLAAKLPLLLLTLLAGYWYPLYLLFVVALLFLTRIYYQRRFGIIYPRLA